jgi:L-asparaginase
VTGKVLADAAIDKTIILTGSMLPESMKGSDAPFNIGLAVGALTLLPPGVYIALNGSVTSFENYRA